MANKLIITDFHQKILYAYIEDNNLTELSLEGSSSILGSICVGTVENIVKNINAAFVRINSDNLCYYPLDNQHIFLNKKNNQTLVIGDQILVQVNKEGIKTKNPMVTGNISLTGKYCVLDLTSGFIGISNKITDKDKIIYYKELVSKHLQEGRGVIVRTGAISVSDEEFIEEIVELNHLMDSILEKSKYVSGQQIIYKKANYISYINGFSMNSIDEIITDVQDVYNELRLCYEKNDVKMLDKLKYYEDDYSLKLLYNLSRELDNVTKKKVWLKSGAYLIIEQTEAMVVIDVNTGKSISKKSKDEHFFKVNVEAALEISRQLRLRNLSGIIIIDFINMGTDNHKEELINYLKSLIAKDKVKTTFVDITKLNLVELTRKKIKKTVLEQIEE